MVIDISDDHEVEVLVDGEEHSISIGQLKRLAGQEKSLTRKSQEQLDREKKQKMRLARATFLCRKA